MPTEKEMKMPGTGVVQSPEDYRYVNVVHVAGATPDAATMPASFHIDYSGVPDLYQRQIGACTNHAYAEIRMHRELRLTGATPLLSPRFTYALCKIEDGITDETNQGTYPVMPLKIGVKYGICTDATVPNDTTLSYTDYIYNKSVAQMPEGAFKEAQQYRIPGYAQVGSFNNVTAAALMQGLQHGLDGVKACLGVGTEWWTSVDGTVTWGKALIIPIRKMVTRESGHDITITGMEAEGARWRVYFRNHWSKNWASTSGIEGGTQPQDLDGDNGWFYLDDHTLNEAWIITEIPDAILAIVKSLPKRDAFGYDWTQTLQVGSRGPDVQALQIALKVVGTFPFTEPTTTYFGPITKAAVMKFQREYNVASEADIISANGALGPKTRGVLNSMFKQ